MILRLSLLLFCLMNLNSQASVPDSKEDRDSGRADSLTVIRNLRYAPQPDSLDGDTSSDKLLDIYLPMTIMEKKLPVFIFVHGGGFAGGDKQSIAGICSKLAAKGFAVLSVNYWLTLKHHKITGASASANMARGLPPDGTFHPGLRLAVRNASDDLILAFKWLKKNQKKYNLDISKVAISGGSAGAMTVLHTAYASDQKVLPIRAVVDLWGGLENAEVIKKDAPPVLIYHGDQDKLIHVDYGIALKKRMDEIENTQSLLHVLEGRGHAMYKLIESEKIDEIAQFLNTVME